MLVRFIKFYGHKLQYVSIDILCIRINKPRILH